MPISVRSIALFTDFRPSRALRWVFAAAVLVAIAAPNTADAARRTRVVRPGSFDGTWNVTFTPQAGNCHASNTVPFTVAGTRVSSAGGGRVTGGVSRNGSVSGPISGRGSSANGSTR